MESDVAKERRLLAESQETFLGQIVHKRADVDGGNYTLVRVEVSWEDVYEDEKAGFYHAVVPNIPPTGREYEDVLVHPASLASDLIGEHLDRKGEEESWGYWSVDEVFPA